MKSRVLVLMAVLALLGIAAPDVEACNPVVSSFAFQSFAVPVQSFAVQSFAVQSFAVASPVVVNNVNVVQRRPLFFPRSVVRTRTIIR